MITRNRLGATCLLALVGASAQPMSAMASSHREAPLISDDPAADNADLYVFASPDVPNTVTLLATYIGLEEPGGGPNWLRFSDDVLYEIKIDNNGDGRATDVVYQFRFNTSYNPGMAMGLFGGRGPSGTFLYNVPQIDGQPTASNFHNALVAQSYNVNRIAGGRSSVVGTNLPVPPVYVGRWGYGTGGRFAADDVPYTNIWAAAAQNLTAGAGRAFAGPSDDPFFVDLGAIFDEVTIRNPPTGVANFGNNGGGIDNVAGYNVHTIGLQVPIDQLVAAGTTAAMTDRGNVIGVYATASRPRVTLRRNCVTDVPRIATGGLRRSNCQDGYGQFVQVSRLGIPLINEVIIPLEYKDAWNAGRPLDDGTIFGQFILAPSLPTYAQVLYGAMGLRVAAGYTTAGLQRNAPFNLDTNDMAWLVTGRFGALTLAQAAGAPGLVNSTGMAPADLLRFHVRTSGDTLPSNAGNPTTLATGRSRLGFCGLDTNGFPNGRRLFDDVVDIEERYVLNGLTRQMPARNDTTVAQLSVNAIQFGDGVDGNDDGNVGPNGRSSGTPYRATFPYVQIPLRGDALLVHRLEPVRTP